MVNAVRSERLSMKMPPQWGWAVTLKWISTNISPRWGSSGLKPEGVATDNPTLKHGVSANPENMWHAAYLNRDVKQAKTRLNRTLTPSFRVEKRAHKPEKALALNAHPACMLLIGNRFRL
ncbi:MAG: hypothetical protein J0L94_13080 [Rhodothermia bacterium]|nr:hypothetical protein [Rhodothermia bacterium]